MILDLKHVHPSFSVNQNNGDKYGLIKKRKRKKNNNAKKANEAE